MQNIGAAALFLPAIQRISKTLKIPISKLLMPIGFSAILGGTVTLVGSSPLILLNDLLVPFHLEPFGLFDVTPVGLALVVSGILCFVVLGRFILPQGTEETAKESDGSGEAPAFQEIGETFELTTPDDYTHYRDPVRISDLKQRYLVNIVALMEPPDFKIHSPASDTIIRAGIDLVAYGPLKDVRRMAESEGMQLKDQVQVFKNDLADHASGTVEAVVAPRSSLEGKTLEEANLKDRFQVTPLAIYRQGETYRAQIGDFLLRVGDAIVLHGDWKRLQLLQKEGSLLFTTPVDVELIRPEKAVFAASGWPWR